MFAVFTFIFFLALLNLSNIVSSINKNTEEIRKKNEKLGYISAYLRNIDESLRGDDPNES